MKVYKSEMYNWSRLQTEFDALREGLFHYRLDYQWGAGGTFYSLTGGASSNSARRFKILADIAGRKLQELPIGALNQAVLDAPDSVSQWYETLRHHSDAFQIGLIGKQTNDTGDDLGNIYTGSLDHPADSSALVCLKFSVLPSNPKHSETANRKTIWTQINTFLKHEAKHRGYLWFLIGFFITAILATLAL